MYYLALLIGTERDLTPEEGGREMTAYEQFHAKARTAIRAGDALTPASAAVQIAGGPDWPVITDGPFAEGAEVAGGYYVFEADNLDDALELARQIPFAQHGAVEIWPMEHFNAPTGPVHDDWLALLVEPVSPIHAPHTDQWNELASQHVAFAESAGDHFLGGAPLHPPATATTVRVRDGQAIFTDGPFAEGAEVANGFYLLRAADRDEVVKLASMIPASTVQLRQLSGIAGL